LSQIGYVVAYAISGVLADGLSAGLGIGVGRGAGFVIMAAGGLLAIVAVIMIFIRPIKQLETT